MENKRELPKINELYENKQIMVGNHQLNILLNQEPKSEWVKTHPLIKNKYIPIEIIEYLATSIFGYWNVEIKNTQLLANSIVVTVRVSVRDPLTGEMIWNDGVGASPIQTEKEAGAIEFNRMKSGAIQMSAPSAETFAIKDAFEKFGKLFGKDLNRKDTMNYSDTLEKRADSLETDILCADVANIESVEKLLEFYEANAGRGKAFDTCIAKRKKELETITIS